MNISKYNVRETEIDDRWDEFVKNSANGTAFLYSAYLNAIPVKKKAYYCYKSQELMGAVLVAVSEDGRDIVEHDFIIYSGLIYRDFPRLNRSQQYSEQFRVQTCVAEFLMNTFGEIRFSLHPSIIDIRPFLWVNYDTGLPKFHASVRYTSIVNIADFSSAKRLEDISIYRQASVARRQEIRYAAKKGVVTEECSDVRMFVDYYSRTMGRQGIEAEEKILIDMERLLVSLLENDLAMMVQSKKRQGQVGSTAVYLLDNKRAYYLFGASDPEMRSQHTGTAVLWDTFLMLASKGYKEVDLEGINSPRRGWFKLSFGGNLLPYYQVNKGASG